MSFIMLATHPINAMYKVKMNGEIVGQYIVGDADSYTNPAGFLPLIIPPVHYAVSQQTR